MKALAASSRAGVTPPPRRLNPAELSGVVARRDSVVGMRVLEPGAGGGGLPGWFWAAAGCLSVIAVGLGAFSYLNLSSLILNGERPLPLATVAGMVGPSASPTIVTIPAGAAASAAPADLPAAGLETPPPPRPVVVKSRKSKKLTEVDAMLAAALGERERPRAPAPSPAGKKAEEETPPAAPVVAEASAPVKSPIEDVNAALDDLQPKLKQCFRRFQIPGVAKVKLTVDPSGAIEPASLSGDFEGTPTGDCVMQELQSATLPPFKGTPLQLSHAFVLR